MERVTELFENLFCKRKLDTTFIHSLWYTALFTVVSVLIINVISFLIAMALTKGIRVPIFSVPYFSCPPDWWYRTQLYLVNDF